MTAPERFERLPAGEAGGAKLCGRDLANPALDAHDAIDDAQFHRLLERRLGRTDDDSDARYSYAIRDRQTGLAFTAYSAQSGPSYGGDVSCFEPAGAGFRLRDDVLAVLADFERWIDAP